MKKNQIITSLVPHYSHKELIEKGIVVLKNLRKAKVGEKFQRECFFAQKAKMEKPACFSLLGKKFRLEQG